MQLRAETTTDQPKQNKYNFSYNFSDNELSHFINVIAGAEEIPSLHRLFEVRILRADGTSNLSGEFSSVPLLDLDEILDEIYDFIEVKFNQKIISRKLYDDITSILEVGHTDFFTPHPLTLNVAATKAPRPKAPRPQLRRQITANFDVNTETGKISYGTDCKSQNAEISEKIYEFIEVNYNQGTISENLHDDLRATASSSQKGSKQFSGGKYEKGSMQRVFDYVESRVATGDSAAATAYVHTHCFFTPTEAEHAPKTSGPGC